MGIGPCRVDLRTRKALPATVSQLLGCCTAEHEVIGSVISCGLRVHNFDS